MSQLDGDASNSCFFVIFAEIFVIDQQEWILIRSSVKVLA